MTTDLVRANGEPRDLATANPEDAAGALAHILATGDLSKLTSEQRVAHYLNVCSSLGLNPLSRPFDWLMLDGRLVLYDNKSCAEQLRRQHQISVKVTRRDIVGDMFVCEVEGRTPNGRTDQASKYVPLKNGRGEKLTGNNLANAFAKAETGAKRRLVLSMIGLSAPPDLEDLRNARVMVVDGRGNIVEHPTQEQRYLAEQPRAARALGEPVFEDADVTPFEGASQAVRPDELERPKREGPRPTFRASDEDVKRWCGAWFGAVKGLSLDTDEARHAFVENWTRDELEWPEGKQTDSLRTMFLRMTESEAGEFLAHVRALMEDEKRILLEQARENMPDPASKGKRDKVADSVALTGGPAPVESAEPAF